MKTRRAGMLYGRAGSGLFIGIAAAILGMGVGIGRRYDRPDELGGGEGGSAGGAKAVEKPAAGDVKPVTLDVRSILARVGADVGAGGVVTAKATENSLGAGKGAAAAGAATAAGSSGSENAATAPATTGGGFTLKIAQDVASEAQAVERERVNQIMTRAAYPTFAGNAQVQALSVEAIQNGWSPSDFGDRAMQLMLPKPLGHASGSGESQSGLSVAVGASPVAKAGETLALASLAYLQPQAVSELEADSAAGQRVARALGFDTPSQAIKSIREAEGAGLRAARGQGSLRRLAIMCVGQRVGGRDKAEDLLNDAPLEFARALNSGGGGGHSSGDFPAILANTMNKAMRAGFQLYEPSWPRFCDRGSVRDFREIDLVSLSEAPLFKEVKEGQPVEQVTFSERKEKASVETFARRLKYSWKLMINDDMGLIQQMTSRFPRMAAYVPENLVLTLLSANTFGGPTMSSDGVNLFHASHKNLGAGAALSYDAVRQARTDMLGQTDFGEDKIPIDMDMVVLMVGPGLFEKARDIALQQFVPGTAGAQNQTNLLRGVITPVLVRGLAANSTRWWMAVRPGMDSAIVVNFLGGQETPSVFAPAQTDPFSSDVIAYVPGVGASARGFETIYTNPGA